MKNVVTVLCLFMVATVVFGMEIIPPEMVLRQVIKTATLDKLPNAIDISRIRAANTNHTAKYVSTLLVSLQTKELRIQRPNHDLDLKISILAPCKVDFIFEARHAKWVDGADYTYYVIVDIKERCSGKISGPASSRAIPHFN